MATITFLVPVRNPHRGFLTEALASIVEQTDGYWRALIITDPGDGSLDDLSIPDPRITRIYNEGKGLSGALNTGMRRAATRFVAVLLGDDRLDARAVEVLGRFIHNYPEADFFHSSLRYTDRGGRHGDEFRPGRSARTREDFQRHVVTHLMCWKAAKALEMGGVDEHLGLHGADDFDFPWSMWEAGALFQHVPDVLYFYRVHHEHYRLTTHVPRSTQVSELRKIFTKHGLSQSEIDAEIEARLRGYLHQAMYP